MPAIDAKTSLYCVIGNPIEHSLSPKIHNFLFSKYGINAVYLAFNISGNNLKSFFSSLRILNIKGCNITLPHKIKVLDYLDKIDSAARVVGSVNTILNKNTYLTGYNTDIFGIEMCLKKLNVSVKNNNFLVLGAGGAARAVMYYLARNHPVKIYLANRTYSKALALKNHILKNFPSVDVQTLTLEVSRIEKIISEIDCVINATSIGIKEEDSPVLPLELLKKGQKVFDLTYSKKGTRLVKGCQEKKIKAIDGIPMLIYQAMKSFQIWTGIIPDYKLLEQKLKKEFK